MKKGFTLIEVLVVTAIVGLLAAVSVTSYTQITKSSRDARRKAGLGTVKSALEMYRSVVGTYPTTGGTWRGSCSGYVGVADYIPNLAPTYMQNLPHDPRESQSFPPCNSTAESCYIYRSDGLNFKLVARCGKEGSSTSTDPYNDPKAAWAPNSWAVYSSNTSAGW